MSLSLAVPNEVFTLTLDNNVTYNSDGNCPTVPNPHTQWDTAISRYLSSIDTVSPVLGEGSRGVCEY